MKIINQISSGGFVYKKENNHIYWLICQHSQHKGWVFPKGLVGDKNSNESIDKAALREVEEEGGIKARIVIKKPIITNYQYQWKTNLIKKLSITFLWNISVEIQKIMTGR